MKESSKLSKTEERQIKKLLLFTGAGISAPLGLPTTSDFTFEINNVCEHVTTHIIEYLGEAGNDVERILATLEAFS